MQSFKAVSTTHNISNNNTPWNYQSFFYRGEGVIVEDSRQCKDNNNDDVRGSSRYTEMGELDQHPVVFHHQHDAVDLSRMGSVSDPLKPGSNFPVPSSLNFGSFNPSVTASHYLGGSSVAAASPLDAGEAFMARRVAAAAAANNLMPASASVAVVGGGGGGMGINGHLENRRGDSGIGDASQHTDTSTDVDTDDRNGHYGGEAQHGAIMMVESTGGKIEDEKRTLKRLAQNREAARKSRLRKKAYVQQLESSRLKLAQLEQDLEKARQQGIFIAAGYSSDTTATTPYGGHGALAFDASYSQWRDEHHRIINELRSALNSHHGQEEELLRPLVDNVMLHYEEFFKLKGVGIKSDIFYMLSGMWRTPAERVFMWLGGFRSSELLKILVRHLEPLTDQQLIGFCNLQQCSQQAEDALCQGMEALQQSLVETLSSTCLGPSSGASGNVADYMGQMAVAMAKLATLENFAHQADILRQQTLQQLYRILTTRQAAQSLLVIHDYTSRLRALSSLWLARPKNY